MVGRWVFISSHAIVKVDKSETQIFRHTKLAEGMKYLVLASFLNSWKTSSPDTNSRMTKCTASQHQVHIFASQSLLMFKLKVKSASKVLGHPSQSQQRPHLSQDFWDRLYDFASLPKLKSCLSEKVLFMRNMITFFPFCSWPWDHISGWSVTVEHPRSNSLLWFQRPKKGE